MKQTTITLLLLLAPIAWLLLRPRFSVLKARLRLAGQVGFVAYFGLLAYRLTQTGVSQDELVVAAIAIAIFGGAWGIAWLVTRTLAHRRRIGP